MFQEILRLIGELRRSHHHRQHEMFDSHAFKSNRREDCVRMPSKTARSGSRKPLGWSGMPVAIHPSRSGFQAIQKIGTIQASSGIIRGIPGKVIQPPVEPDGRRVDVLSTTRRQPIAAEGCIKWA
jgi:hypothetical protein